MLFLLSLRSVLATDWKLLEHGCCSIYGFNGRECIYQTDNRALNVWEDFICVEFSESTYTSNWINSLLYVKNGWTRIVKVYILT